MARGGLDPKAACRVGLPRFVERFGERGISICCDGFVATRSSFCRPKSSWSTLTGGDEALRVT